MSDNELPPTTLPRAPVGSKRGWPVVSGQVPPDTARRLALLAARRSAHKGDVLREAVEEYLDRQAA